jgi:hypothetical protein
MRSGGGKQKGNDFERDVCRRLSLWASDGKHVDLFWRSAMSGGRATARNRERINVRQAGDICAVAPDGHPFTNQYYVECKAYRNLQIDRFIILGTGTLMKFWRKTKLCARKYGRRPMLIAKQNGFPPIMVTGQPHFSPRILVTCHRAHIYLLDEALKEDGSYDRSL